MLAIAMDIASDTSGQRFGISADAITRLRRVVAASVLAAAGLLPAPAAQAQSLAAKACPGILQHRFDRLQDEVPQDLCQFAGKVVLVVNTASFCGFTHQYEGLEKLQATYQSRGLVVLGFPSNDFGQQEPGSAKQIADFCFNTYGVKFPMFAKSDVKGDKRNPLYADLLKVTRAEPQWNFNKYLVDRTGKAVIHYSSNVEPDNSQLVSAIEKALNQKL